MQLINFTNIKEIKFTKIGKNTYSISINSDMINEGGIVQNTVCKLEKCTIDSMLSIKTTIEHSEYDINGRLGMCESYSIPMNINLLINPETENIFTITKEDNNE